MEQNIYLFVQFNFPKPFQTEYGLKAKNLNQSLVGQDWIEAVLAASGGIGGGPSSLWVFKLGDYASLDRLFHGDNPVAKDYIDFFSAMEDVHDFIREEVVFT